MSDIHNFQAYPEKLPKKSYQRAKNVALGVGTTVGILGTLVGAGYAGIEIGRKDDVLTTQEQESAYRDALAGMSPGQRYMAEFVTGVNVCNPEDRNNFFENIGVFSPIEACGRTESSSFPEPDESLGRTCLMNSVYDPSVGAVLTLDSDASISVESVNPDVTRLLFNVNAEAVTPADQPTQQILKDYNC